MATTFAPGEMALACDTLPTVPLDGIQNMDAQAVANHYTAMEVTRSLEFLGRQQRIGHFVTDGTLATTEYSHLFHASKVGDDSQADYVVKVQALDYPRTVDPGVPDEIAILARLPDEPTIPTLVETGMIPTAENAEGYWYMVMPRARGTLADRLPVESHEQAQHVLGLVIDAVRGAMHGHAAGYAHNDIKPSNILDNGSEGQLTDWGSAVALDDPSVARKGITPQYSAPEIIADVVAPNPSSDVYSLGATLVAAVSDRKPLQYTNHHPVITQPNKHFAPAVVEIAEACVDSPPNRPTPPQLLASLSAQLNLRQHASPQT